MSRGEYAPLPRDTRGLGPLMGTVAEQAKVLKNPEAKESEKKQARTLLEGLRDKALSDLADARTAATRTGAVKQGEHAARNEAVVTEIELVKVLNVALGHEESNGLSTETKE